MNEPIFTDPSRDDDSTRGTLAHVRDVSEELVRIARATATRALGEAPLVAVLRALLPEIEHVYAERERLAEDVSRLHEQAAAVDARIRDLEIQLAGHAARSAAEHAAFEAERDRARSMATDLARQGDALALAETREQQLRSDIEALASRAAAEREDTLGLAREMVQAAEDARTAAASELDTLRTRLATSREVAGEDPSRRDAELAAARTRVAELEAATSRLTADLERVRANLADTEAKRAELARRDADESTLDAELAEARERTRSLEHALVNAETAAAVATERANMLSAELVARAHAARCRAAVEPGAAAAEASPPTGEVAEAEPMLAEPEPAPTEPEPVVAEPVFAERRLAVIDACEAWDAPPGVQADLLPLAPEIADRVREIAPDACVVNLAATGALATVMALRAAEVATPLWGCAVAPNGTAGIALGTFEVLARPIDPARVCASLGGLVPPGAGAIVVGSDTTTLMAVRQGLLQAGLSVRTAWNRAQASDLVDGVHPGTVIVDLASESAGAAELVADLARRETPPLLVLIPGSAQQQDDFAAALAARAFDGTGGSRADLLAAAARPTGA